MVYIISVYVSAVVVWRTVEGVVGIVRTCRT